MKKTVLEQTGKQVQDLLNRIEPDYNTLNKKIDNNTAKVNGLTTRVEKNEKDIKNIGALDFSKLQEDLKKAQPVLDSFEDTIISGKNMYNKALYAPKSGYFNMIPILADGSLVKSWNIPIANGNFPRATDKNGRIDSFITPYINAYICFPLIQITGDKGLTFTIKTFANPKQFKFTQYYDGVDPINSEKWCIRMVRAYDSKGYCRYVSSIYQNSSSQTIFDRDTINKEDFLLLKSKSSSNASWTFVKQTAEPVYLLMGQGFSQSSDGFDFREPKGKIQLTQESIDYINSSFEVCWGEEPSSFDEYGENTIKAIGIKNVKNLNSELETIKDSIKDFSAEENLTIANSDKIGLFSNSYMEGYTARGQHPTIHLGSLLDYQIWNFSVSGQNLLTLLEGLMNDRSNPFNTRRSTANLTYAIVAHHTNDGVIHSYDNESSFYNLKLVNSYFATLGTKMILSSEHSVSSTEYNYQRFAAEHDTPFTSWGYVTNQLKTTQFDPWTYQGHPSTRTHWTWTKGLYEFIKTLPMPRKAIKLFRARDDSKANDELLFTDNYQRASLWQDFCGGYTGLSAQDNFLFDRLVERKYIKDGVTHTCAMTPYENEYNKLSGNGPITANKKVLAEFIVPYTSSHLSSVTFTIDASNVSKIYIRKTASLKKAIDTNRVLSFGLNGQDSSKFTVGATLVVSKGDGGNVTGSGDNSPEGSFTIVSVLNGYVTTNKNANTVITSGTDVFNSVTVNGTPVESLKGSYSMAGGDYWSRYQKPLAEWQEINLDANNTYTINRENYLKMYEEYDTFAFLLESDGLTNIIVNNISAKFAGDGTEKDRNTYYTITKEESGHVLTSIRNFTSETSKFSVKNGTLTPCVAATYTVQQENEKYPLGTKYTETWPKDRVPVNMPKNTLITIPFTWVNNDALEYMPHRMQMRVVCRNMYPYASNDELSASSPFANDKFWPVGSLKVSLSNQDYVKEIHVNPWWNEYIFDFENYGQNSITLLANSDYIQLSSVDIIQTY